MRLSLTPLGSIGPRSLVLPSSPALSAVEYRREPPGPSPGRQVAEDSVPAPQKAPRPPSAGHASGISYSEPRKDHGRGLRQKDSKRRAPMSMSISIPKAGVEEGLPRPLEAPRGTCLMGKTGSRPARTEYFRSCDRTAIGGSCFRNKAEKVSEWPILAHSRGSQGRHARICSSEADGDTQAHSSPPQCSQSGLMMSSASQSLRVRGLSTTWQPLSRLPRRFSCCGSSPSGASRSARGAQIRSHGHHPRPRSKAVPCLTPHHIPRPVPGRPPPRAALKHWGPPPSDLADGPAPI